MADKAVKVAQTLVSPAVMVGSAMRKRAVKSLAFAEGDFAKNVETHKTAGTDMATFTTKKFIETQFKLVPYRVDRIAQEWAHLRNGGWRQPFSFGAVVIQLRFFIRLMFVYMLFLMGARNSIMPLMTPDSPFLESLKTFDNPNW